MFVDADFSFELIQPTPLPGDAFPSRTSRASSPRTLPLAVFSSLAALLKRMWGLERPRSFSRAKSLLLTGLM